MRTLVLPACTQAIGQIPPSIGDMLLAVVATLWGFNFVSQ